MLLLVIAVSVADATSAKKEDNAPKPAVKFFVFREDCFDTFFVKNEFANIDCLKFSISKLIGYLIISGAMIIKVPQILKIYKNKSVHGISKSLFYLEIFMYLHSSSYSLHHNIPFSVYGENYFILVQNFIIVLLFWTYSKEIGILEQIFCLAFISGYSFLLFSD